VLFLGVTSHEENDRAVNAKLVLAKRVLLTGSEHAVTPPLLDNRLLCPNNHFDAC